MDYVAWWGRSLQNIGTGNLLYPQGLSTLIWDIRISVLVLDSIVDDVAMIVDTRDNLRQQFFSLFLWYWLIETLSRRSIEKLWCAIQRVGHQLACRWSIQCKGHDCSLEISRHQSPSLLVLCQIDLQCEPSPWLFMAVTHSSSWERNYSDLPVYFNSTLIWFMTSIIVCWVPILEWNLTSIGAPLSACRSGQDRRDLVATTWMFNKLQAQSESLLGIL